MSKITIEKVKNLDDSGRVARVHHMSRQKAYAGILPPDFINSKSFSQRERQWYENVEKSLKGDGAIWIAQCNGFDAGVVAVGATRDVDLDNKAFAELYVIYVMPDYWGGGIGKQLFDQACEEAKKANFKELTVWVYEANEKARKFYERQGMKLTKAKRSPEGFDHVKVVRYSMPLK